MQSLQPHDLAALLGSDNTPQRKVVPLAQRQDQRVRRTAPPYGEGQRPQARLVEPLHVVDGEHDRALGALHRKQGQGAGADGVDVRQAAHPGPSQQRGFESQPLRLRQCVQVVGQRCQQVCQSCVAHLALDAGGRAREHREAPVER